MAANESSEQFQGAGTFNTTHWSVVLEAGQNESPRSASALEKLCQTYWYPLYTYVRRYGHNRQDAEDLTQDFFTRLLGKNYVAKADRDRGKFRTFLLGSLKNFMLNEWKRAGRLKRGGGPNEFVPFDGDAADGRYSGEGITEDVPENAYEKQWAVALIEQVFAALRTEYAAAEKAELLQELKQFVWGEESTVSYAEIGEKLKMSEGTVKVSVHRLRKRFRELLREEVAQTVARPDEIDDELRHLIAVLS
jgi:RNA polymerase sigma factor (sigma-70 family)